MRKKSFLLIALGVVLIIFAKNYPFFKTKRDMNILLLPSLPKPIAKEYALITSAGQSTDAYIVKDIANTLLIHNYFMPQASSDDLKGINTVIFVVGHSPFGKKLHGLDNEGEKKRITQILEASKKDNITVLTIYIGVKKHREKEVDEMLSLICPYTDYLISTKEADYDNFLSEIASKNKIPISLVSKVNNISEPFASAFR